MRRVLSSEKPDYVYGLCSLSSSWMLIMTQHLSSVLNGDLITGESMLKLTWTDCYR